MFMDNPQDPAKTYQNKVAALQLFYRQLTALDRLSGGPASENAWLELYCGLLADKRPFFSPVDQKDKFAELVELVGRPAAFGWLHDEAAAQLQDYSLSRVQGWARGVRPSDFFLARFVPDLQDAALRISDRLAEETRLQSILSKPGATAVYYETGGM